MARVHSLLERVARQQSTLLMGIVNVTPNSFYDGGRYEAPEAGRQRVVQLLAEGADIVDIGGESSKPGAPRVSAEAQLERIGAALGEALEHGAVVSVDTASPAVAEAVLARGAHIINDVTCLSEPELASVVARHQAHLIVSHARAHQSEMKGYSEWPDDDYSDVVADVRRDLDAARAEAERRGVRPGHVWYDPGLGFSKNARHTIELLSRTAELAASGCVVVVGASRKSFIRTLHESAPEERLGGTLAASLWAARAGARVLRVHDVAALRQALLVESALAEALAAARGVPSTPNTSPPAARAPR
ncbi:MAG TPA: dihydropteroate synthase [Polyangiaceae bacterium]|nr:dihydropteroate synthase [Polyangiaceae bacterium]